MKTIIKEQTIGAQNFAAPLGCCWLHDAIEQLGRTVMPASWSGEERMLPPHWRENEELAIKVIQGGIRNAMEYREAEKWQEVHKSKPYLSVRRITDLELLGAEARLGSDNQSANERVLTRKEAREFDKRIKTREGRQRDEALVRMATTQKKIDVLRERREEVESLAFQLLYLRTTLPADQKSFTVAPIAYYLDLIGRMSGVLSSIWATDAGKACLRSPHSLLSARFVDGAPSGSVFVPVLMKANALAGAWKAAVNQANVILMDQAPQSSRRGRAAGFNKQQAIELVILHPKGLNKNTDAPSQALLTERINECIESLWPIICEMQGYDAADAPTFDRAKHTVSRGTVREVVASLHAVGKLQPGKTLH